MDMEQQLALAAAYGWGPGPDTGQPGGTNKALETAYMVKILVYYVTFFNLIHFRGKGRNTSNNLVCFLS